ncbi:MAG: iron-sulfur cluster assembly scaffold protein [Desulfobacterales bacterium]|jgi:nitrogen fixation protein NifU and related proteins|nr:iron-sulfur cluster assembly scaffold protein [Desulfobacteraceae bacterium]MBT4363771.1 iron-sulfur cluster assembly scaffold protein [Desulfobacteraceae bacterium]MBT7084773.1 iron-sulfur cluster assembly scaffold protein [Desulfobacterales bacterium]
MTDKESFDFWQDHSIHYLEMAFGHERRERVSHPDGYGKRTGDCGDTVEFFLTIESDRVSSVAFDTDGCLNTNACANTIAHMSEGSEISEAWEISPDKVIDFLGTLPPHEHHCAELAVGAFYLALSNYEEIKP